MLAYIKGILRAKYSDSVVVETAGLGFSVNVPLTTLEKLPETGGEVKLYTYAHIREDGWTLYGFLNDDELKMFEQLIKVSGVGPKAAVSLISYITPSQFSLAVLTDDVDTFVKVPGIGKKTALRIILELKDKFKKEQGKEVKSLTLDTGEKPENKIHDAVSALIMLGYTNQQANAAVAAVYNAEKDLETIIRDALKSLAG
ncbi:holliday junction ATP-dependent DNA helicase RuvA [Thermoclostridium stercorarium subsp. stercorarium DSM 8532]|jgi:Holliday junction DNA helicase RuvA|uniref:Holliday junction branch migration complex subunit RuvA n=3 Tax=Thermoclostridium stercorarium TaxID=1510 RepID=L7VPU8_THES1|nr:Holliday junction branch migration protein RuvA [Thermoclostridium stercorarium]AGC68466.1 holliday junction ATP-dependent DNA helicase RuvA [Thermoclostridium stercorarium subsp. stercorarium DSM 8532]AGI39484.1 RuvA [Thermoclostridium stercorarium subsp. stercorarium DSM 8532]ANW98831.1 Holliday junction ATP-dependent DNA helicase RuvA [Thermoclostridium stercorarium subsp. thermolacticum DSM 2910]ANX01356.1 Holliday junction ATP-dependent DNA helicase RuvA [Thermoclostridium stercorarium 